MFWFSVLRTNLINQGERNMRMTKISLVMTVIGAVLISIGCAHNKFADFCGQPCYGPTCYEQSSCEAPSACYEAVSCGEQPSCEPSGCAPSCGYEQPGCYSYEMESCYERPCYPSLGEQLRGLYCPLLGLWNGCGTLFDGTGCGFGCVGLCSCGIRGFGGNGYEQEEAHFATKGPRDFFAPNPNRGINY